MTGLHSLPLKCFSFLSKLGTCTCHIGARAIDLKAPLQLTHHPENDAARANILAEPTDIKCRNCGGLLTGGSAAQNFCPRCGQETTLHPPTVLEFARQFGGNYIAPKGALLQTLKVLVFQPGQLSVEWREGRRKRYILPLRLYLTLVIVFFFVLKLTADLHSDMNFVVVSQDDFNRALGFLAAHQWGWADGIRNLAISRLELAQAKFLRDGTQLFGQNIVHTLTTATYYAIFVMLPLQAAALYATYRKLGWNYGEHLLFALTRSSGLLVFMLLILIKPNAWLSTMVVVAAAVHSELGFRHVYGPIAKVVWRRLVLVFLYQLYALPVIAAAFLVAILF